MADSKKYNGSTWEHSLRKLGTATDTITTLPADLYADGNSATVDLVGNMSQTGTPTQSSPITPQETGDLETTGEHTGQFKIPLLSGGVTTNVYLGEVQSTRKIQKIVLTGEEAWTSTGDGNSLYVRAEIGAYQTHIPDAIVCSHCGYTNITTTSTGFGCDVITSQANNKDFLAFRLENYQSVTPFKNFLAAQYANGTPVTVWYVLATPETGIVNEPIRKIGTYADTVSGITIPTITGKDTFDVETTLKPSEVELTYTGWHDASAKEWDGSEWQ